MKRTLHICLLCYRGNPYCGGQGIYIYNLSRELASLGQRITILVGPPYPDPMPWARLIRIENPNFWGKKKNFLPSDRPFSIFKPMNFFEFSASRTGYFPEIFAFSFRAFNELKGLLKKERIDVVHDVESLGYGDLMIRAKGIPLIATVHHPLSRDMRAFLALSKGLRERYYNIVFFPLLMQRLVIRRMDRVITSSIIGKGELISTFGVPDERIRIVYSGTDTDAFKNINGDWIRRNGLLFVGNAQDPKKGISTLLEAMRKLRNANVVLTVVDEGEPSKFYAPNLVKKMGLLERVRFTGKVSREELIKYYCNTRIVVIPSIFEGFGLPAVEAMACGTPVVATNVGALPEVIGKDGAGVLVPPGDPYAMAEAIDALLSDEGRCREMGSKGRRRVEEKFSWKKTAMGTMEVYRELTD